MRYCIEFSYFGKNYFGYQIQPNQISVQEKLEKALSTILRTPIKTTGAGRTDTGVHAKKMYAHFDYSKDISDKIVLQLNSFLPPDISVKSLFRVNDDFHARFHATYRTYQYHISTQKNPFLNDYSWTLWKKKIDINKMNEACEILLEYTDFQCFEKVGADNKTHTCKLYKAFWEEKESEFIFTISADRFLRNMVRAIVGTMVDIGTYKYPVEYLREIILSKNRNQAGTSAPAKGLFLVDVGYPFSL